jgi:hypothetical protein
MRDPEDRKEQESIEELQERLDRLPGGPFPMNFSKDCPDEVKESFLKSVLAFEEAEPLIPFDELVKGGLQLPAPEEMDESHLSAKLEELISGMAFLGIYLEQTDHLSDRELYLLLWTELLREPTTLFPDDPDFAFHLDILGSCSEEDIQLYLKYYADDEERQRWAQNYPEDSIPPHESPRYDRDQHLPKPHMKPFHE